MKKEAVQWLRSIGFEEDRSFFVVMQKKSRPFEIGGRQMYVKLEVGEDKEGVYTLSATVHSEGTTPENYSEQSMWLFNFTSSDVTDAVKKSANILADMFGHATAMTRELQFPAR